MVGVYGRRAGLRVCVGEWFQFNFYLFGVDDAYFSPPYDKFYKWYGVIDVIVLVPSNNEVCAKVPVYKAVNEQECVMVIQTP